jgi:hypothetical protein
MGGDHAGRETMDNEKETKRMRRAVGRAMARRATDLDRIEYLALALDVFAQPVPAYEPRLPPRIVELLRSSDDHSSPSSSRR